MVRRHRPRIVFLNSALLAVIGATSLAQSPASAPSASPKTAGEGFKNIQVLKDSPAEQLVPAMQFITASLGVGCDHCHVRGAFEKDDKEPKKVARKMMQMTAAINQNNFDGHREVTCYSCHRGGAHPVSVPIVMEEDAPPVMPAAETPAAELPNGEKLVEKYLQALGKASDLNQLSSRVEKGKAVILPGREFPLDNAYQGSDKLISITHMPDGDLATGYNQNGGWQVFPGRPLHDMSEAELHAAKLDSTFYFPLHVKELYSEFKTTGVDKIGGHAVYVVTGRREKQSPVRLYFDTESGLLLRLVRYDETPLGPLPVQVDHSDYREVNGIKIPFTRTTARPGRRITIKIEQVEQNTKIDDSKFEKPAAASTSSQPAAPK